MKYIAYAGASIIWLLLFYTGIWVGVFHNFFLGLFFIICGFLWPSLFLVIMDYFEKRPCDMESSSSKLGDS